MRRRDGVALAFALSALGACAGPPGEGGVTSPEQSVAPSPTAEPSPTPSSATPVCGDPTPTLPPPTPAGEVCAASECPDALRLSELMPDNEGAYVDEIGQTDDWVELVNVGDRPLSLLGFTLQDSGSERVPLPGLTLPAGGVVVLFADDSPDQGERHLPFKLSAGGESLTLRGPSGEVIDAETWPALAPNDAWVRLAGSPAGVACRFASPALPNGASCGPQAPPSFGDDVQFCPYRWPEPSPGRPSPLALDELVLSPAQYVELVNTSDAPLDLGHFDLRAAPLVPNHPWPGALEGVSLSLSTGELGPGERVVVEVSDAELAPIAARVGFEGVVTLFERASGEVVDRVSTMGWPQGAALARIEGEGMGWRWCDTPTRGQATPSCAEREPEEAGSYTRAFYSPGDFALYGAGEPKLGVEGVKFIVDLDMGGQVYLLNADVWDLHYTFVREVIEGQEHLDRCDPQEAAVFNAGWAEFSEENYFTVEGRRYLLGWLAHYSASDLWMVEYSTGDAIVGSQMSHGLFTSVAQLTNPTDWAVHAQDNRQVQELLSLSGQVPAVGPNAPYAGATWQPLNEGVGYGVLKFIPSGELAEATLGSQVLVITDEVPLDIDLVGGLITEAFQTPLSHVAVLSRNRGTPNMALPGAHLLPDVAPWLGELVRLEVTSAGYHITPATPEEAQAFWDAQQGGEAPAVPAMDTSVRGIVPLEDQRYEDLPSIGGKASLFAELARLARSQPPSEVPIHVPESAFAIPIVHYVEHMDASGAAARLAELLADPTFTTDPTVRERELPALQAMILEHPVDPALLGEVEAHVAETFGDAPVRFRSSSNTEDIEGFSGAGLYTSVSGVAGSDDQPIEDAIRVVWASLWNVRAYEERLFFNISQTGVGMAVLCHEAWPDERANGVAITRNVLDPTRNSYYINVQFGEASVTNPAPGVSSDELLYRFDVVPPEQYLGRSSFTGGQPVLSSAELNLLVQTLKEIHTWFKPILDPAAQNQWFAMDVEFKLIGEDRSLLVKQARPYSYGRGVSDPCP